MTRHAQMGATEAGTASSPLAAIVESSDDAIIGMTLDGVITSWNAGATAMYGYAPEEMIGHNIAELIPPDHTGELTPILGRLSRGERMHHFETRRVRKDGTMLDVSVSISPILDSAGRVTGAASVARDITARVRSAEDTARLAAIVESSADAIIGMTLDGVITSWNAGATAMYGYAPEEMIGHNIAELIPPEHTGELTPILGRLARGERAQHYETQRLRKDGTMLDVSVLISPILDGTGAATGAASVARDVSGRVRADAERRVLQARLRHSERLETVGQLAGGLAHEFNNLLGVIVGYAGILAEEIGDRPELRADLQPIMDAAERAGRLTRQLLIFSRRDTQQLEELSLNEVVAGVRELLVGSLGSSIVLEVGLEAALPRVRADRGHVEQVLMNLAVNARDAMPEGGTLRITTGSAVLDDAYCAEHPDARPGQFVELTVRDTGTGMSPEIAARAFEPFFTTKPPGRGTGLGLATVHGAMTRAGGSVSAESQEGVGTVFRCYFPAVGVPDAPGTGHRILVVDDEPTLLDIAARILRKAGYIVIAAHNSEEALSLASAADKDFDLVLTDSLPTASGPSLADRLTGLMPGLRVLHMSGYSAGDRGPKPASMADAAFIEKPFTAQQLLEKVRSALGSARHPGIQRDHRSVAGAARESPPC